MVSYLLHHLLDFIAPLSLIWLLMGVGWLWNLRRGWRGAALFWLLPWTLLTLLTCTSLPSALVYTMEKPWLESRVEDLPNCDVIVCLGGGVEPAPQEATGIHLQHSADRVATALLLAKAGKAPTLVVSGGVVEDNGTCYSEANAVVAWIEKLKLSPIPVLSLGACENTHDEAVKIDQLCEKNHWKRVLLLSSATHLARAEATFRKAGVDVTCFPCNFSSSLSTLGSHYWIHAPNSAGFDLFEIWWHEKVGWFVYHWRGWL